MGTMMVNLDNEINRRGTGSVKYRSIKRNGEYMTVDLANPELGKDRVLQMWVADMDFQCCPTVIEALKERLDHGIFGYTSPEDSYFEAVIGWAGRRYGWEIEQDWIMSSPGVVPAIYLLVPALTKPDEKVLIQRPVYFPFTSAIENANREVVSNSLIYDRERGRYEIDFDDLAEKAADPKTTLAILCSPHNPVGRVWTKEELSRMAQIFLENGVTIISDEIHCDLIFEGHTFVPMASISDEVANQTITCMAPSKTFNLAGLKNSNIIISNPELREIFEEAKAKGAVHGVNTFGMVATEAAYQHGEVWLDNVMAYVQENDRFLRAYLAEHLPAVKVVETEGTYLSWVDFSGLGIPFETLQARLIDEVKVHFNVGDTFGPEGEHFMRINIACPRSTLEEALDRLKVAFG